MESGPAVRAREAATLRDRWFNVWLTSSGSESSGSCDHWISANPTEGGWGCDGRGGGVFSRQRVLFILSAQSAAVFIQDITPHRGWVRGGTAFPPPNSTSTSTQSPADGSRRSHSRTSESRHGQPAADGLIGSPPATYDVRVGGGAGVGRGACTTYCCCQSSKRQRQKARPETSALPYPKCSQVCPPPERKLAQKGVKDGETRRRAGGDTKNRLSTQGSKELSARIGDKQEVLSEAS